MVDSSMMGGEPGATPPVRRLCVFCGRPGKLTKEHVLRDKFNLMFTKRPSSRSTRNVYVEPDGSLTEVVREHVERPYSAWVRRVCETCNNGWMNALEHEVEPVLVAMMRGRHVDLPMEFRQVLARWAAKTALMRQFQSAPELHITEHDYYRQIYEGHAPLGGWLFAARTAVLEDSPRTRSTRVTVLAPGHTYSALLTMLHLEAVVLVSVLPLTFRGAIDADRRLQHWDVRGMTPIYPSRRLIDWASTPELETAFAAVLVEIYAETLVKPLPGEPEYF